MTTRNEIRDRLTDNAFRFLAQAADELAQAPGDALIHLCSGLELLMKARLAHEHWSLVADQPGSRTLAEVRAGDFKSVAFHDAIKRLENVTGIQWDPTNRSLLHTVAGHRNRVLHFYHHALDGDDDALRAEVAKEQCRAWAIFRALIAGDWKGTLGDVDASIGELDTKFRQNHVYLAVVFEQLGSVLQKARVSGREVRNCSTCKFDSMVVDTEPMSVKDGTCLVCGEGFRAVQFTCPACGGHVETVPDTEIYCSCGQTMELSELLRQLGLRASPSQNCWTCTRHFGSGSAFSENVGPRAFCIFCMQTYTGRQQECRSCGTTAKITRTEPERSGRTSSRASVFGRVGKLNVLRV